MTHRGSTSGVAIALFIVGTVTYILLSPFSSTSILLQTADGEPTPAASATGPNTFTWNKAKLSPAQNLSGITATWDFNVPVSVPLNYSDPEGSQMAIAMTRIRSSVPVDSPLYRGPILLNPGGPGGSGVDLVIRGGNSIATIVGPQFDVVGFDPRGVARSTPQVSWFEPMERALWGLESHVHPLNASRDDLAKEWARAKITNGLAGQRQSDLLRHINTDQTARDMLRIVQAHGRENLQYWGFSYGSVLGSTFAAMFPDRVERLIIDGVVDVENYFETLWSDNLLDTDKTMQHFFDGCYSAGPLLCPFYAPSPKEIAQNLSSIYDALRKRPIPVLKPMSYGLVDYNRLRMAVFGSLYSPYASFSLLSEALSDLAAGKGERLLDMTGFLQLKCDCGSEKGDVNDVTLSSGDAQSAILCNDGAEVSSRLEDFEQYFKEMSKMSQWGELWSGIRASCIGWPKLPKTHFRGPVAGNTSFPILLIGNTADPVTPLWAAKKVAKGFPGSIVLTQDGPGHCSLSAPSPCTVRHVRNYFANGILPPPDTKCPVIGSPFSLPTLQVQDNELYLSELSVEDRELLQASRALSSERLVGPISLV